MRRRRDSSMLYAFTISPLPYPVLLVVVLVLVLLGISSYLSYEDVLEDVATQINLVMLVIPVLIVIILRWLWTVEDEWNFLGFRPYDWKYDYRRRRPSEGSSPWWVAALLVLLLVMITFQSTFHDQWLFFGSS
ncbi:uncharacterized protein LOC116260850 [Nymphaea colorata]|uniref:uncharacterized protein LOC116260850 n=1 Tax=Nymphaea colorata TaxID=210225 RepID=UPI00129E18F1|nr:uncharacterized protein LOC116260850 [Nymphaea colorata]